MLAPDPSSGREPTGFRRFLDRIGRALQPILDALEQYYASLQEQAEVFRGLVPLGPLGWTISTYGVLVAFHEHKAAAEEARVDVERASAMLEELWCTSGLRELICSLVVYAYDAEERELAERRRELLLRASRRFDEGLYAEAVLLVYSQLDGIFHDRATAGDEQAYAHLFRKWRPRAADADVRQFTDIVADTETMIGTEHEFFLGVRELLSADVKSTTLGDDPSRHGVLHGRVLGYDNRRRAAQAFAFLAGCMEILTASRDEVPMTAAEADATPLDEAPPALRFLIWTRWKSPVRSVYLNMRGAERTQMLVALRDAPAAASENQG